MRFGLARAVAALVLAIGAAVAPAAPAAAHTTADPLTVYPPIRGSSTWGTSTLR
ncbi:hypothetical protein [Micromonospora inyonensis]|uniref:Uncharacterized protein n=1 Tax=Micromonospora inyonensis TaxID=47866 RepID=A0A1C6SL97_9ACTN|nr:hypothetical protein [Micromonospora inyonensis]SCL30192.1 hypothetical protein GA0074694_5622 [Micromonospora inyonensis]